MRSSACGELARSEPVCGELACPELAEGVELVELSNPEFESAEMRK
jgi:hypothetical protein